MGSRDSFHNCLGGLPIAAARAAWLADAFALAGGELPVVKAAVAYRRGILEHGAGCDGLNCEAHDLHTPLAVLPLFKAEDSKPRRQILMCLFDGEGILLPRPTG